MACASRHQTLVSAPFITAVPPFTLSTGADMLLYTKLAAPKTPKRRSRSGMSLAERGSRSIQWLNISPL